MTIHANSPAELCQAIRGTLPPQATGKGFEEFIPVRSWAFSDLFLPTLGFGPGPCSLGRGDDPPDFVLTSGENTVGLEVTTFTTARYQVRSKHRREGGFTSTLRLGPANKRFQDQVRSHSLPDDSMVNPHFENVEDLHHDYLEVATEVLVAKHADLGRYLGRHHRNVLLVWDKLSMSGMDYRQRPPALSRWLRERAPTPRFNEIILVDGSTPNVQAVRLAYPTEAH